MRCATAEEDESSDGNGGPRKEGAGRGEFGIRPTRRDVIDDSELGVEIHCEGAGHVGRRRRRRGWGVGRVAACGVALVAHEGKPGVGGGQVFGGRGEGDVECCRVRCCEAKRWACWRASQAPVPLCPISPRTAYGRGAGVAISAMSMSLAHSVQ